MDDWDYNLFDELQQLLVRVTSRPTTSSIRRLYSLLHTASPWLLSLTHLPGPSEESRCDVEKNPVVLPSGTSVHVSGELLATSTAISSLLHISQRLAATLTLQAEELRSRYPSRNLAEISTYIFHDWTSKLLSLLHELLRLTIGPSAGDGQPFDSLREWVKELLVRQTGSGVLVDTILSQLDGLQRRLDSIQSQRASGPEYDLLVYRVASIRSHQNQLVGMLGTIAQGGMIGRGHVIKMLKWLKQCSRVDALVATVLSSFYCITQPLDRLDPSDPRYQASDEWCRDVKFLKIASNLIFVEPWSIRQLCESAKLAWSLFILSTLRHDPVSAQIGIDPPTADQYLVDAIAGEAFQSLCDTASQYSDPFILEQIAQVADSVAAKKHFLRNLRNREEDVAIRRSTGPPPANFQAFLSLLAILYKNLPPDSAQHLWNDTAIILDNRTLSPAYWQMLQSISTGPICAANAYEKLQESRLQWLTLFKFYSHYNEIMPHLFEPIKTSKPASLEPMKLDEVEMCLGWTRVLETVVKWSPLARSALLQAKPHPLQTMFDFINCDVPIELKAAVLDAITAFCAGDISETASKAIEHYERITFAPNSTTPIGWVAKMEYTEVGTYPLTRAYLGFLTALIPSTRPKTTSTLRSSVSYIIDRVLLQDRRYADESEQWNLLDSALCFMEKALFALNMGDLLNNRSIGPIATALHDEPGFVILLRLLSEPPVFNLLASVVDNGNPVLARVLRIYHRVLDIQLVFSDVLVLALVDRHQFKRPTNLTSLDHLLLGHLSNVESIALLVGSPDPSISFASTKIIATLASSLVFNQADRFRGEYTRSINRLAGIIDASDDSIRIAQGFCNKLEGSGPDLSPEEMTQLSKQALCGAIDPPPLLIRSTILDMLIDGTLSTPNIAHFLLGFEFKGHEFTLQDANAPDSRYSCLQVVLQQLDDPNLINIHPVLASKTARLIYQLFSHPSTGRAAMSYGMSIQGFSANQLASLPRECPLTKGSISIHGSTTSADTLVAYLDFQRWIISCVALETHAFEGRGASASVIANVLFKELPPLITDLLNNIDLVWQQKTLPDKTLEFYAGFDFDRYKRDVDWWDIDAMDRAMQSYRRQLERQGALTAQSTTSMMAEAEYLVQRLTQKNQDTEINVAQGSLLTAWSEMCKVALGQLFSRYVSEERQDVTLFELVDALLDRTGDVSPLVLDILCESILVTLSTLTSILDVTLPVERLADILSRIIEVVIRPGITENARGNLYASISQLLTISASMPDDTSVVSMAENTLQRATLSVLGSKKDRFFSTLCRDAMDMRDVWKTECFALLGGIVSSTAERDRQVLAPLKDYLPMFVRSIKDREMALLESLSSDDLHVYWVFEAKVAFLLAIATTRKGAEDLLDAGIFEILSTCSFIAIDDNVRQHSVLVLTLQLLIRTLTSLHKSARTGAGHAMSFLDAHRDSILLLMREAETPTEECRLIISILTMVIHKVPEENLRSSTGFGAFHLSVLSVAARFFDSTDNLPLNQVILTYLCATTSTLKSGSGYPVLVNGARSSQYVSTSPSLQTAVDMISDLTELVRDLAGEYEMVSERLRDGGELTSKLLQSDVTPDALQPAYAMKIQMLYNMIESLLLLVWRHLLFYANDRRGETVRPGDLSVSMLSEGSRLGANGAKSLEKVAAGMRGVLERVDENVPSELKKMGDAYFGMLVRRLNELTAGLTGA